MLIIAVCVTMFTQSFVQTGSSIKEEIHADVHTYIWCTCAHMQYERKKTTDLQETHYITSEKRNEK